MTEKIIQMTHQEKIIAIVRGIDPDKGLQTVQALYDGGIHMVEVTFDQKNPDNWRNTTQLIQAIDSQFSGKIAVGAGTVTTPQLVELAAQAGAKYIISPDAKEAVIRRTRELGLVSMPGAVTPTEITTAYDWGAHFVKLFPIGALGVHYVKALVAPLNHIPLLAVGGVNTENVTTYLDAGCVGAGIGGNLVNAKQIAAGEFDKITQTARQLVEKIQNWRNEL